MNFELKSLQTTAGATSLFLQLPHYEW